MIWGFCFNGYSQPEPADSLGVEIEDNGIVIIPPLFEYIEAPDDLPDLQSRTDYLLDNFWNPFDFDNTKVVDQNALNHAFGVYVQMMPFSSDEKILSSIRNLVKKIGKNPGLSYQFTKAAEENLYGPRAYLWADEGYLEFVNNFLNNKDIDESKKTKYRNQFALVQNSVIGAPFPKLELVAKEGSLTEIPKAGKYTILEITPLAHPDFRYTNLKLDISGTVNEMIDDGLLDVGLVLITDSVPDANYPQKWNVYASPHPEETLDIRKYPCFYVIGKDKKIEGKNLSVDDAISLLETLSGIQ